MRSTTIGRHETTAGHVEWKERECTFYRIPVELVELVGGRAAAERIVRELLQTGTNKKRFTVFDRRKNSLNLFRRQQHVFPTAVHTRTRTFARPSAVHRVNTFRNIQCAFRPREKYSGLSPLPFSSLLCELSRASVLFSTCYLKTYNRTTVTKKFRENSIFS